ncbi:MAG TPA: hypothetical protein VK907_14110 [Phnomibacter sp.]|nr:hypothetical protein [Phnomibacter sp.]
MKNIERTPLHGIHRIIIAFAVIVCSIHLSVHAQKVGIGTNNPQAELHVVGTMIGHSLQVTGSVFAQQNGRFDGRVSINGVPNDSYRLLVNNGHTFLGGNLNVANDGIIDNNFRVNGRVGINGATDASYGLIVNNSNSYFQGNTITTGTAFMQGNMIVSNDGIIDNNLRVNGRVGINGPTNANFGLYVNNSNSYFQGNVTVSGTLNAPGDLTIKGNGHVRSNGSSSLRVGFNSKYVNVNIPAGNSVAVQANIANFTGVVDNVRVMVAQVVNDNGSLPWSLVNITVMGVNAADNTCLLWLHNTASVAGVLKGTIYLTTIAKD